ncbi:Na(+)-translocating NADH-quinone reductase subunit C [Candidatus Rubidus massiliensis]|nr:Na(+)-translocating NADH-quinone reductase subunit C [Candidatus Rubidus massiliensis]
MSEQQLANQELKPTSNNLKTILFMVVLSFTCALILSILASALANPKQVARNLDRSKQMMIAAKILDHNGHFIIENDEGKIVPAKYQNGELVPGNVTDMATNQQLLDIYEKRLIPLLVDNKGELKTFEEAKIDFTQYMEEYRKNGYYLAPYKLIYKINPNKKEITKEDKPTGYVIPVNGLGLWDAIYGYLAIKPDGDTVIGTTWYDQKETPGLGANISEAYWQNYFPGKKIFQENASGQTNYKSAPVGIIVVKGKVDEVLGNSPKAKSAVDGMAGATLTGNGVTDAYKNVLSAYRPFLIKINQENKAGDKE